MHSLLEFFDCTPRDNEVTSRRCRRQRGYSKVCALNFASPGVLARSLKKVGIAPGGDAGLSLMGFGKEYASLDML